MAAQKHGGLGKGLGALLHVDAVKSNEEQVVQYLDVQHVHPNTEQPRKHFDTEKLRDLADSIKKSGVIIPVIVTKSDDEGEYQIVAGERRWRASKLAGLKVIPCIVRELSDIEILQQALIENIQRQDLNPLEEAEALKKLITDYNMKQEALSSMVGKSRPAITNILRLLNLSPKVKDMLVHEEISAGHARALLSIEQHDEQVEMAERVIQQQLSVRQTEKMVKIYLTPKTPPKAKPVNEAYRLSVQAVEDRFMKALGTKVSLKDRKNKGTILIEYYSAEDLERILEKFE